LISKMTAAAILTSSSMCGADITRLTRKPECFATGRSKSSILPRMSIHRFGADWGFAIDPTVLVRCHIDPENRRRLYVDREVSQVGCEIDHTPKLFEQIEGAKKWIITAELKPA
jgi:hypothetical protein